MPGRKKKKDKKRRLEHNEKEKRTKMTREGRIQQCSKCKKTGHNARGCKSPGVATSAGASGSGIGASGSAAGSSYREESTTFNSAATDQPTVLRRSYRTPQETTLHSADQPTMQSQTSRLPHVNRRGKATPRKRVVYGFGAYTDLQSGSVVLDPGTYNAQLITPGSSSATAVVKRRKRSNSGNVL